MKMLLNSLLTALCLLTLSMPALAQKERAYAPEDLGELSYNDQVRVISLEYEEQSGGRRIPDDQLRFYLDQVNQSDWTFSRIKSDIAKSLGSTSQPGTVRCESFNNQAQICRVPWTGASRLVRQLSSEPCREGITWQSQQGQVYVGRNCRAEFAAAGGAVAPLPGVPDTGQVVRCESFNNQAQICRVPWSGASRLSRRMPGSSACTQGVSWQSQQGQVYVGHNCRAEFVAGAATKPLPAPAPITGHSVTCSSAHKRYVACPWPPGYGRPRLLEQLSRSPCIEGLSWGVQSDTTIWVNYGCRGRFGN